MSRMVTALFASRSEAHAARASLAATVKVESAKVVAQDTVGALVGLPIEPDQLNSFRKALAGGDHLVVATVTRGANPQHIVSALSKVTTAGEQDDGPRLSYSIGEVAGKKPHDNAPLVAAGGAIPPAPAVHDRIASVPPTPASTKVGASSHGRSTLPEVPGASAMNENVRSVTSDEHPTGRPVAGDHEDVRIGQQQVARSGGRSIGPDASSEWESQRPVRRLTDDEVQAGGLLKERVIEVIEMREVPVIAREVVVREEVTIRKTAKEQSAL